MNRRLINVLLVLTVVAGFIVAPSGATAAARCVEPELLPYAPKVCYEDGKVCAYPRATMNLPLPPIGGVPDPWNETTCVYGPDPGRDPELPSSLYYRARLNGQVKEQPINVPAVFTVPAGAVPDLVTVSLEVNPATLADLALCEGDPTCVRRIQGSFKVSRVLGGFLERGTCQASPIHASVETAGGFFLGMDSQTFPQNVGVEATIEKGAAAGDTLVGTMTSAPACGAVNTGNQLIGRFVPPPTVSPLTLYGGVTRPSEDNQFVNTAAVTFAPPPSHARISATAGKQHGAFEWQELSPLPLTPKVEVLVSTYATNIPLPPAILLFASVPRVPALVTVNVGEAAGVTTISAHSSAPIAEVDPTKIFFNHPYVGAEISNIPSDVTITTENPSAGALHAHYESSGIIRRVLANIESTYIEMKDIPTVVDLRASKVGARTEAHVEANGPFGSLDVGAGKLRFTTEAIPPKIHLCVSLDPSCASLRPWADGDMATERGADLAAVFESSDLLGQPQPVRFTLTSGDAATDAKWFKLTAEMSRLAIHAAVNEDDAFEPHFIFVDTVGEAASHPLTGISFGVEAAVAGRPLALEVENLRASQRKLMVDIFDCVGWPTPSGGCYEPGLGSSTCSALDVTLPTKNWIESAVRDKAVEVLTEHLCRRP